jgi:hypothetical protein
MKCDGHAKITDAAIELLAKKCSSDSLIKNAYCESNFFHLEPKDFVDPRKSNDKDNTNTAIRNAAYANAKFSSAGPLALTMMFLSPQNYRKNAGFEPHKGFLTHRVVAIDIDRIYIDAHFPSIFKGQQKRHFMKEIDQGIASAHSDCSKYVSECMDAWVSKAGVYFNNRGLYTDWRNLKAAVEPLALALHAFQDSFSPGHVERVGATDTNPGAIKNINVYDEDNKVKHGDHDYHSGGLDSTYGKLAVLGSAELMHLSLRAISMGATNFSTWSSFKQRWLRMA